MQPLLQGKKFRLEHAGYPTIWEYKRRRSRFVVRDVTTGHICSNVGWHEMHRWMREGNLAFPQRGNR